MIKSTLEELRGQNVELIMSQKFTLCGGMCLIKEENHGWIKVEILRKHNPLSFLIFVLFLHREIYIKLLILIN